MAKKKKKTKEKPLKTDLTFDQAMDAITHSKPLPKKKKADKKKKK